MKKLYKRKSDWLVEYPHFDANFLKYLFIRSFSFIIDFMLFLALQWIFQKILGMPWIVSGAVSYVLFTLYNMLMLIFFKGKTLGLKAGKLETINKLHTKYNMSQLMVRASISGLFALSYVGYAIMAINALSIILSRGLGLSDLLSKTQVVSTHYASYLRKIEDDYDAVI